MARLGLGACQMPPACKMEPATKGHHVKQTGLTDQVPFQGTGLKEASVTGWGLPFIDGKPACALIVLADEVRRQVRCAPLLDLNGHPSLVVDHILCLDSDDLHGTKIFRFSALA